MIFGLLYFCVVILCVNRSRTSFILYRIVKRHSRQSNVRRIWTCADNGLSVLYTVKIFKYYIFSVDILRILYLFLDLSSKCFCFINSDRYLLEKERRKLEIQKTKQKKTTRK